MDLFEKDSPSPPFEIPEAEGFSLTWQEELRGWRIQIPHGEVLYVEQFFDNKISDRTVEYFQENDTFDWKTTKWKTVTAEQLERIKFKNINWKQDTIKMYGKRIPLPRLTSWYGDSGKSYTYSGISSQPTEWNKGLLYLKKQIENCAGVEFNSVLLNWYRDGTDQLSWHADDEEELGRNPIIASANFGETRDFIVRKNDDHSKKITFPLKHGTFLLMAGEMQHHWQHQVPERKRVAGSRFNLTFRRIGV